MGFTNQRQKARTPFIALGALSDRPATLLLIRNKPPWFFPIFTRARFIPPLKPIEITFELAPNDNNHWLVSAQTSFSGCLRGLPGNRHRSLFQLRDFCAPALGYESMVLGSIIVVSVLSPSSHYSPACPVYVLPGWCSAAARDSGWWRKWLCNKRTWRSPSFVFDFRTSSLGERLRVRQSGMHNRFGSAFQENGTCSVGYRQL